MQSRQTPHTFGCSGLLRCLRSATFGLGALMLTFALHAADHSALDAPAGAATPSATASLLTLGVGDAVSIQVYGRPELSTTTYVSDNGAIPVPLAGSVPVAGLSPAIAAQRVATAYRDGNFLINPQVNVFLVQSRSQQVSVLGAVHAPGRFVLDSKTTVIDVLAQAGGITDEGGTAVVLLRPDASGAITRQAIDLNGLSEDSQPLPSLTLRGGDSIFVPTADRYYIYGEVVAPNMYRLEPHMTLIEAISRSGGITPRGSNSRIEIKRRQRDGTYATHTAKPGDTVEAGDVIRVKERIF